MAQQGSLELLNLAEIFRPICGPARPPARAARPGPVLVNAACPDRTSGLARPGNAPRSAGTR